MEEYEFNTRSVQDVVLAIFDSLGVKLSPFQINYVGY